MYCTRKIYDDIIWVGADNRRLKLFEAVYNVPRGISYNSYLILDEKTALIDTADRAVTDTFIENVEHTLGGRALDYLVVQHMEPDHSATLLDVLLRHPECTVVCNKMTLDMIKAFKGTEVKALTVKEGDVLDLGKHKLTFVSAPMVHWPEVMVTFDTATGTLFSADAFGTFGALNGALFADEVDFDRDYLDEARRYYCNIVGKYGMQVEKLLGKASALDIKMICPLHGFVWRENIDYYVNKYVHWAGYKPEEQGVVIAYASVYGNTENAANVLACRLLEMGIKCVMHDVSVSEHSAIIADCFKCSHLVFASMTYNGGVFVNMENLLRDLAAHALKGRKIALIESGSWALTAGKGMREILSSLKDTEFISDDISFKSSLGAEGEELIDKLAHRIKESI
ncbi:MAG: FprA family A-type flavoprotein [Clostridia bacterium]|nr:FprA family A-type flavoprotein [Clostridia bacterium]